MNKMVKMMQNRKGFTVIELIVVVVVIGILVAFGIPRILSMTAQAKRNTFNSNIKIISDALERYYVENDDEYPGTGDLEVGLVPEYLKEIPVNPLSETVPPIVSSDGTGDWDYTVTGGIYQLTGKNANDVQIVKADVGGDILLDGTEEEE